MMNSAPVEEPNAVYSQAAEPIDQLPPNRLHLAILAICSLGFAFDLMEVALGSMLAAVFSSPPHTVSGTNLAWLLSSMYLGAIIGAPVLGQLADRIGRRRVLRFCLLFVGATSLMAAFAPNFLTLTFARGLSGVALGAYPPLMLTYLTDVLPPRYRGALIMLCVSVASVCPAAMLLLIRALIPSDPLGVDAWRWGFIVGSVGAIIAGLLFTLLPESPRWLRAVGRTAEAQRARDRFVASRPISLASFALPLEPQAPETIRALAPHNHSLSPTTGALLSVLYFFSSWATVGFILVTGPVLAAKGVMLADALLLLSVISFAPAVSALLGGVFVDRISRRTLLLTSATAMIVFGTAFAGSSSLVWLLWSATAFSLMSGIYVPTLPIYVAEFYPTRKRGSASSALWAFNRIGCATVPLILLPVFNAAGTSMTFAVISSALALVIVILLRLRLPDSARRAVI